MNRALVIGGNGFIGSHLVDSLAGNQWDVMVIDKVGRKYDSLPTGVVWRELPIHHSSQEIETLLGTLSPQVVFNLAWETLPETSLSSPTRDIARNIPPALHVINACTRCGVKLVFISSGGAVYGNVPAARIAETQEANPISPYGIEKLMAEKYLFMYRALYGLDYLTIRPSTPFGPRQDYLGKQGAVAVFMYRVARGLPVHIWGDGSTVRDYFFISDLAEAMTRCADYQANDEARIFNVGGGEGISLIELLDRIQEAVGKRALLERYPARKFDPERIVLDTSLIREKVGWAPRVSLADGIRMTWEWMKTLI